MRRWPGLHGPSIRGRAWADRGPLLLTGTVAALATLLASAVPVLMPRTGDKAIRNAVTRAGDDAALRVSAAFSLEMDFNGDRVRPATEAADLNVEMDHVTELLGAQLQPAVRPPYAALTSPDLTVGGFGPGRVMELAYVAGPDHTPAVTWTKGGPPKSSVPANDGRSKVTVKSGMVWPVQVGLSEATAAELKIGPGARISAVTHGHSDVDIRVSGIFRANDPADPTWQADRKLLRPVIGYDGTGTRIELAALMSSDSLPDGELAIAEDQTERTITYVPEPRRLGWETSAPLVGAVVKLKAGSASNGGPEAEYRFESGLDRVLTDARAQVIAAAQQASVLLVGLVGTAALVLLLAADLLVRRRALVLAGTRMRGASLVGIGAELIVESIAVTFAGVALGLLGSVLLTGDYAWPWLLPVAIVAVLGGPVLGMREAARATQGRQAPANRSARQTAVRTSQLRRVALEATVVLATAAAFAAMHQRGVVSASPDDTGGNLISAIAPTLGAITGALVLLRLMPLGVRLALNRAVRYRGSLPLFAAARAAATAARPLPLIVLVLSSALLTFSFALAATESNGQDLGAWRSVGGDVRVDVNGSPSVPGLAQRLGAQKGVRQALSAHVTQSVTVASPTGSAYARLVVVDSAAFARLLRATPLPDAPDLSRLRTTGAALPVLLRAGDGSLRSGPGLTMLWNQKAMALNAVGEAPAVGDSEGAVVIADAATFAAAGAVAQPNTVWVIGSGAEAATTKVVGTNGAITTRDAVLSDRRDAPLAAGIFRLTVASVAVLLLFGLLSVGLGAAVGAPARGEMLARLRTLGLQPRQARRVAFGELLPPVAGAAIGGLVIGVLLVRDSIGRLALRLITGQAADPDLVVPWLTVVPLLLLVAAVVVVVAVESSLRRRERLGQVLRAGNQ